MGCGCWKVTNGVTKCVYSKYLLQTRRARMGKRNRYERVGKREWARDSPGVVNVDDDPWSDGTVNSPEVLVQPLPLGTARSVVNVG